MDRDQIDESARSLIDYHKALYSQPHEFVHVDARDFSHLDLKFYQRAQKQLESLGFEKLADLEDVTLSKADSTKPRLLIRVMLSRDRRTTAGIYAMPSSWLVKVFQWLNLAPKGGKVVDLESEFADSTFLVTSNTQGLDKSSFPGIEYQRLPWNTGIRQLVKLHRQEIQRIDPENPARIIENFDRAIAMAHRLEELKNKHKQAQGYLTREDIQRYAKKGQKKSAQLLTDAVERVKAEETEGK